MPEGNIIGASAANCTEVVPPPAVTPPLRRSSRSTRGKHSRFSREDDISLAAESAGKKELTEGLSEPANDESDVVDPSGEVQCVCRKYYENDEQMMAQCEKCDKWQHVKCLFGKEDESLLPEQYYCHRCEPGLFPNLKLAAVTKPKSVEPTPTDPSDAVAAEVDTTSSSNMIITEDISPVEVDEKYSPPIKKRKVDTVSFTGRYFTYMILANRILDTSRTSSYHKNIRYH